MRLIGKKKKEKREFSWQVGGFLVCVCVCTSTWQAYPSHGVVVMNELEETQIKYPIPLSYYYFFRSWCPWCLVLWYGTVCGWPCE